MQILEILVINDSGSVLDEWREIIENAGYNVIVAPREIALNSQNGKNILEDVKRVYNDHRNSIDAVVTDISFGKPQNMLGFSVISYIRTNPRDDDVAIPIYIVSLYSERSLAGYLNLYNDPLLYYENDISNFLRRLE